MFLMHFGLAVLWLALVNKWTVIAWSYEALSTGLWPSVDHNGEKWEGENESLHSRADHELELQMANADIQSLKSVTHEKLLGEVLLKAGRGDRAQLSFVCNGGKHRSVATIELVA